MEHVLAVDLGGTKCSAAVVDRNGRIISRCAQPVDLSSSSAPVRQITQLAQDLAERAAKQSFAAAAVAVPGLVRRNGTVWAPNLPGWDRMPLADRLKRSLGLPVVVESDRNAALLGECWRGAARGKSDVIVLMIGTGIGAGIMSGGHVVRGAHELSGCVGWMTVSIDNNSSKASMIGELESLAAGPGIANAARKRLQEGETSRLQQYNLSKITSHEIAAAGREGDALALDVFHRAGKSLGFGLANIVSLFDPQIVIIGGGMAGTADLYFESLRETMLERAQPLAAQEVKLVVSKLGDRVNLLGCARLAWQSLRMGMKKERG